MSMAERSANASNAMIHATPDLGFAPAPDHFSLPEGMNFGLCSGVAVNSKDHIFVFNRGSHALMEFDPEGRFVRSLAQGIFTRPHGLRIDAEDNIWTTDGATHIVVKFNPRGRIELVLGVQGMAADWHYAGHMRAFDEPNDVAFGPKGEIYVCQGHGKGESRIIKFDAVGNFVHTWGGEGKAPGQFNVPHSIVANDQGLIFVADRSNERIQVFDLDGNYVRESHHPGTPCGLCMCCDQRHMFMAHGHAGKIMKLDMSGSVLGITGSQGKGPNQYGEAHFLALSRDERTIFVADTLNWRVQKLVKR
jgi:streptogramin lyase